MATATKIYKTVDQKTDQLITSDHHTVASGKVNRGHPASPWEVITRSDKTGEYISTRHKTEKQALRAAGGRLGHHQFVAIKDHTPK